MGVGNADFILYVAAMRSQRCVGDGRTVAYAAHCQQEQALDRSVGRFICFLRTGDCLGRFCFWIFWNRTPSSLDVFIGTGHFSVSKSCVLGDDTVRNYTVLAFGVCCMSGHCERIRVFLHHLECHLRRVVNAFFLCPYM